MSMHDISVDVNGLRRTGNVEARKTLADFLREDCALTGTHLGCEHGVCGACTVLVDGEAMRSCLMFAVQADGAEIVTIEGLTPDDGTLSTVQSAFREEHGLQCGFCTPGFVVTVTAFLRENPNPTDDEIREGISGNLCRCTGYQGIIKAVARASRESTSSTASLAAAGDTPAAGARSAADAQGTL
jgi:carbon-monoxide dehydrogenase small subunit